MLSSSHSFTRSRIVGKPDTVSVPWSAWLAGEWSKRFVRERVRATCVTYCSACITSWRTLERYVSRLVCASERALLNADRLLNRLKLCSHAEGNYTSAHQHVCGR